MTKERTKAIKIVDELIAYFFAHQLTHINIDLNYGLNQLEVTVKGSCKKQPDDLDQLEDVLNSERQEELEDYYASLLGENRNYNELNLLGALVDSADITYDNQQLIITVYRKRS